MASKTSKTSHDTNTNPDSGTVDLAALQAELAELKASKAASDAEARDARRVARDATFANMSAQERAIASDQEANEGRLESLERELTDAESQIAVLTDEGGRGKEVAALTRRMSNLSAEKRTEEGRKTYLAQQREKITGANKQVREGAKQEAQGEVLANGIVISTLDRRSQDWLKKHPEAKTDVRLAKQIVHAAQEAVDVEGIEDNSPEFFAFMDKKFPIAQAEADTDYSRPGDGDGEDLVVDTVERYEPARRQSDAAGPGKMAPIVAARPTRQQPVGSGGGGGRRPTLTNEERETALALYSSMPGSDADKLARYAANKKFMNERNPQHFVRSN